MGKEKKLGEKGERNWWEKREGGLTEKGKKFGRRGEEIWRRRRRN